jgi:hypothetical protein
LGRRSCSARVSHARQSRNAGDRIKLKREARNAPDLGAPLDLRHRSSTRHRRRFVRPILVGLPTPLKSGSSRAPPTVTTYCRPISLAHSPILSTWSCRNSSTAASCAATTRARRCATISAWPGRRHRRGCAKPLGPNNDDGNLDATACKVLAIDAVKDRTVAQQLRSEPISKPAGLQLKKRLGLSHNPGPPQVSSMRSAARVPTREALCGAQAGLHADDTMPRPSPRRRYGPTWPACTTITMSPK